MSLGCRMRQVVKVYVEKVELWHLPGFWTEEDAVVDVEVQI